MAENLACFVFNFSTEMEIFESKFKTFAEQFGDNCALFSTASSIFNDVTNAANELETQMKDAMKTAADFASKAFSELKGLDGLEFTQEGIDLIQGIIAKGVEVFEFIENLVAEVKNIVKQALDAVKLALCDHMTAAAKALPPEIVAGIAALGAVRDYNFAKDVVDGSRIIGQLDIDNLTKEVMNRTGINDLKRDFGNIVNQAKTDVARLTDIRRHLCS